MKKEIEYFKNLDYPELNNKSICFHIREEQYNKDNPNFKKMILLFFIKKKILKMLYKKLLMKICNL